VNTAPAPGTGQIATNLTEEPLLRAHHIIEAVPRTHRYLVTDSGRRLIAAVLAIHNASLTRLKRCA